MKRSLPAPWAAHVEDALAQRRERELLRVLTPAPVNQVPGGPFPVNFSTNDYLGLAGHPAVRAAVRDAAGRHGMGPRGSALVCGHTALHARLARVLADLEQTESALLTPTGYAANLSAITALADDGVTVLSDALNHASIIDGLRLARRSGAQVTVVPHADVDAFAHALEQAETPRVAIVTDSVFSMDGDIAPLAALRRLADRHGALLVVDEAHGTLVLGERGRGACEVAGIHADLVVGTLSKAAGAMGGFIAGSEDLCTHILNHGRAQIYSTALPVPVVAAALAAIEVAHREPALRATLTHHQARLAARLGRPVPTPIVPWVLGSARAALEASEALREAGLLVVAIRPPTVPAGTARLRIALSAVHTDDDLDRLLEALPEPSLAG